jgi:hypothetical protein
MIRYPVTTSVSNPIFENWQKGMTSLNSILTPTSGGSVDVDLAKSILWYYYQSYYNSSFNPSTHQLQFN